MKKILITLCMLAATLPAFARGGHGGGGHSASHAVRASGASNGTGAKASREHVHAYAKKDGTHVDAHNRSTADATKANNWSTKGNVNPDTGKAGTK